jgi:bifunctional DNA-binding transcriptional regulator/antitoxin component of YhaV-PrlF toxin-antitoxin module
MVKVLTVNPRGALTLPVGVRDLLGVKRGGQIIVDMNENGEIRLRAGVFVPLEIYSSERVEEFREMNEEPLAGRKLVWREGR